MDGLEAVAAHVHEHLRVVGVHGGAPHRDEDRTARRCARACLACARRGVDSPDVPKAKQATAHRARQHPQAPCVRIEKRPGMAALALLRPWRRFGIALLPRCHPSRTLRVRRTGRLRPVVPVVAPVATSRHRLVVFVRDRRNRMRQSKSPDRSDRTRSSFMATTTAGTWRTVSIRHRASTPIRPTCAGRARVISRSSRSLRNHVLHL